MGNRWAEYNDQEHAQLASLAFDMLNRGGVSDCARFHVCSTCLRGGWDSVHLCRTCQDACCPVAVGVSSDSWSVKSKVALLLALVVKRQGQQLWQQLQPQLLPLAQQGPVQAEMVGSRVVWATNHPLSNNTEPRYDHIVMNNLFLRTNVV